MDTKILVVDDEESMRMLLKGLLKNPRYNVTTSDGVSSAIELIKSEDFDIIITDKNMPGLEGGQEGGLDILQYSKQHFPETEVIIITGYASIETVIKAMKLGAFDYMLKPLDRKIFIEKIERIIEYQSFMDASVSIDIHNQLQHHLLDLLKNQTLEVDAKVEDILSNFNQLVDTIFDAKKSRERFIMLQMESLGKIASLSEQLKEQLPQGSETVALVDQIIEVSSQRL